MYLVHSSSMIIINMLYIKKKKKANKVETKHESWPENGKRLLQPQRQALLHPDSLCSCRGQWRAEMLWPVTPGNFVSLY